MVYTKELHRNFERFYATWPPNDLLSLGDFGYLQQNVFARKGNIQDDFDLHFEKAAGDRAAAHYKYTSAGLTQVKFVAAGNADASVVPVKAGVKLQFGGEHGVFFDAAGCAVSSIKDQVALNAQILALFEKRIWVDDWHIITSLVECGRTLIVVSSEAGAEFELEAKGEIPNVDLADATVEFTAKSQQKIGYSLVTTKKQKLTPLFGVSALKWKFLKGRNLQMAAGDFAPLGVVASYSEMRRLAALETPLSAEVELEEM